MIKNKLTALALTLPLALVSLTGFAGDDDQAQEESKTEMFLDLNSLVAEADSQESTQDDSEQTDGKRIEVLSENDSADEKSDDKKEG